MFVSCFRDKPYNAMRIDEARQRCKLSNTGKTYLRGFSRSGTLPPYRSAGLPPYTVGGLPPYTVGLHPYTVGAPSLHI